VGTMKSGRANPFDKPIDEAELATVRAALVVACSSVSSLQFSAFGA
jgi:hypothetical protein